MAFFALLLEGLGLRFFYSLMSRVAGEIMLPGSRERLGEGWSWEALARIRDGARYFRTANLLRLMVYVVPAYASLNHGAGAALVVIGFLAGLHTTCIVLEVYKLALVKLHLSRQGSSLKRRGEPPTRPDIRLDGRSDWWFAIHAWESAGLYRMLGIDLFRNLVTAYIENTTIPRLERD
ncbi:MAG: hypothetical protein MH204_05325, partial [Fimbriimonadaceae bacterium]|nr:hypothetical protein [Fimbriimonadaceae bacterium]